MKNRSWMFIILLMFELVIILVLVPGDWMDSVIARETELLVKRMGEDEAQQIQEASLKVYQSTLIDSGVYAAVHRHFIPKNKVARGLEGVGAGWFSWVDGRLVAFSKVYYQAISRGMLIMAWAPYLLILLVPAITDGYCKWKINRESFDGSSQLMHRFAFHGVFIIAVLTIGVFIAPVPLEPLFMPVTGIVLCLLIGTLLANMQKQM